MTIYTLVIQIRADWLFVIATKIKGDLLVSLVTNARNKTKRRLVTSHKLIA